MAPAQTGDQQKLAKDVEDATDALNNARQAMVRPVDSQDARQARADFDEATSRLARANAAYLAAFGRPYQQVPTLPPAGLGSEISGKEKRGGKGYRGKKRRRWPPKR